MEEEFKNDPRISLRMTKKIPRKRTYKNWKERRFYESGAYREPGSWLYLEHPTHTDWYSLSEMLKFIDAAEKNNIDPVDFVAMGISETGLGNQDYGNPTRINTTAHPNLYKILDKIPDTQPEKQHAAMIDYGAKIMKENFKKYPKDRASALQAYSGEGKTIYGGEWNNVDYQLGTTKVFGRPYEQINFWEEKPQAKRVMEIAEILKKHPDLRGMFPTNLSTFLE